MRVMFLIRQALKDRPYIREFGLTKSEYVRQRRLTGSYIKAFVGQRNNAKVRGIGWELSYFEWLQIWIDSGKFKMRGRGQGRYVMSRVGDLGPYKLGNVFIDEFSKNASFTRHKVSDLPIGVHKTRSGKFKSLFAANGRRTYLGRFRTSKQAYRAYIKARRDAGFC